MCDYPYYRQKPPYRPSPWWVGAWGGAVTASCPSDPSAGCEWDEKVRWLALFALPSDASLAGMWEDWVMCYGPG